MKVKWPVLAIYGGLAIAAVAVSYEAKHRPLGTPASMNQALTDSRRENDAKPVVAVPTPAPKHKVAKRASKPAPEPVSKPKPRGHHVACGRIPAFARSLDRDTIVNYAPRYGLDAAQTEQVLRCLHKE